MLIICIPNFVRSCQPVSATATLKCRRDDDSRGRHSEPSPDRAATVEGLADVKWNGLCMQPSAAAGP